jgi:DNA polymerase-3 subunit alpha
MAKWAGYGFNKAHSVGYGFLTLRGAYLKANFKPHFMAALMSANSGNEEKITRYIDEIRARGIKVLPPKINKSLRGFTVSGDDILFGLEAIKGVGAAAIEKIISNYPYNGIMDFIIKAGNRTVVPPLIKAGYFDEDKKFLLKYWEVLIEIKEGKTKAEESLIDYLLENGINQDNQIDIEKRLENIIYEKSLKKRTEKTRNECLNLIHRESYSNLELLNMEKDVLGLFLSESPLDRFSDLIISQTTLNGNIKEHKMNEEFFVIGMVLETPPFRIDKNGNKMCFLKLQMYDGVLDVPVFAGAYEKYHTRLTEGRIIIAKAKKIRGGVTLNSIADLVEKEQDFREYFGVGAR